MWRALRAEGWPIVATWIDEDGQGQTESMRDLWPRIMGEVEGCTDLVLYVERSDLPLKGAFVEVGAALVLGKRVWVVAPDLATPEDRKAFLGSWIMHPNVGFQDDVGLALKTLDALRREEP